MNQSIADLMTRDPVTFPPDAGIQAAAARMREEDTGNVVVVEGETVRGIVTDRDIVVRAIADGRGPDTPLADVLSGEVVTVAPQDRIEAVVDLMRERAVRRIPVVEDGRLVGIVSIGDLAIERDSDSALADISAARENT
ncbi:MAG TPA: CBS domain-containing protein [Acidimicrobiales bacterium]|nr:CBS domain-containing protein [Acidimicrobiales bacterium]